MPYPKSKYYFNSPTNMTIRTQELHFDLLHESYLADRQHFC